MGAATGAKTAASDRVGRYRRYANGIIYWHPDTGAHALQGTILNKLVSLSPDRATPPATLGCPTTDETRQRIAAASGSPFNMV